MDLIFGTGAFLPLFISVHLLKVYNDLSEYLVQNYHSYFPGVKVLMKNEFLVSGRGANGTYTVGSASGQGVWNCKPLGQTQQH